MPQWDRSPGSMRQKLVKCADIQGLWGFKLQDGYYLTKSNHCTDDWRPTELDQKENLVSFFFLLIPQDYSFCPDLSTVYTRLTTSLTAWHIALLLEEGMNEHRYFEIYSRQKTQKMVVLWFHRVLDKYTLKNRYCRSGKEIDKWPLADFHSRFEKTIHIWVKKVISQFW